MKKPDWTMKADAICLLAMQKARIVAPGQGATTSQRVQRVLHILPDLRRRLRIGRGQQSAHLAD